MSYVGIDYGMGKANRDPENGIRYGVISQGTVGQAWYDEAKPDYGNATCPKCGNDCVEYAEEKHADFEQYRKRAYACADYACEGCEHTLDSDECFGDEPQGWSYEGDGYVLSDCLDSDIMVLKSEFYTFAQFCSPCVPGAGNLDNAIDEVVKSYCLGHDWFEEGRAPYRVFRVADDSEVFAS